MCSCIYCRKEYSSKGIFTHVDRSHLQKTHYSSGNNGKYDELSEKAARLKSEKQSAYMLSPKKCSECGSTIEFDQRKNKFCSHSCSAIYTNRKRTEHKWNLSEHSRLKISNKLKKLDTIVHVLFVELTLNLKILKKTIAQSHANRNTEKPNVELNAHY